MSFAQVQGGNKNKLVVYLIHSDDLKMEIANISKRKTKQSEP